MIKVGNKGLGPGYPCFMIAEIGINHNGDIDIAIESIIAAKEAGADGVKFQNYYTDDFIKDRTLKFKYQSQGKMITESQYDLFKRCELSNEDLIRLNDFCKEQEITFLSTPTSNRGIQVLSSLGVPLLKNGSDYLQNLDLIRDMAKSSIPTIISTGMATLSEIDDAVRAFEKAGGTDLILLLCTSSYPTPADEVNLLRIGTLRSTYNYPIGFSDHTFGTSAGSAAVALGACLIEKHFTLSKDLAGPDHRFSADPSEFKTLVETVRLVEQHMGHARIGPTISESYGRENFRLSCALQQDRPAGYILKKEDVTFLRPGTGLEPKFADTLLGGELKREIKAGELINFKDLKFSNE